MSNVPKIDSMTITSTLLLVLALVNNTLQMLGMIPIPVDDKQLALVVSSLFTGVVAIWNWWRNNNITQKARKDAVVLDKLVAVTLEPIQTTPPDMQK